MSECKRKERQLEEKKTGIESNPLITLMRIGPLSIYTFVTHIKNMGNYILGGFTLCIFTYDNGSLRTVVNYWEIKYS